MPRSPPSELLERVKRQAERLGLPLASFDARWCASPPSGAPDALASLGQPR